MHHRPPRKWLHMADIVHSCMVSAGNPGRRQRCKADLRAPNPRRPRYQSTSSGLRCGSRTSTSPTVECCGAPGLGEGAEGWRVSRRGRRAGGQGSGRRDCPQASARRASRQHKRPHARTLLLAGGPNAPTAEFGLRWQPLRSMLGLRRAPPFDSAVAHYRRDGRVPPRRFLEPRGE